jgi:CRP-like cAMP-binding protein
MISVEVLSRYPFFGGLTDSQKKSLAIIAQEEYLASGITIFYEGENAEWLYFLEEGCISLYYTGTRSTLEKIAEGIPICEINPGEPFSISAIIEPYVLTSTARVSKPSRVIKIKAQSLRALFEKDYQLAYILTRKAAKAVVERLNATRVQLAAAWT